MLLKGLPGHCLVLRTQRLRCPGAIRGAVQDRLTQRVPVSMCRSPSGPRTDSDSARGEERNLLCAQTSPALERRAHPRPSPS